MKKPEIISIVLFIVGVILVAGLVAGTVGFNFGDSQSSTGNNPMFTPTYKISCGVTVKNSLFYPVVIESYSCNVEKPLLCSEGFWFFGGSDKGNVVMTVAGISKSEPYQISEISSQTKVLTKCVKTVEKTVPITLEIIDDENIRTDSREFTLQVTQ